MGQNKPTTVLLPLHSKTKCASVPITLTNTKPIMSSFNNVLLILSPIILYVVNYSIIN